MTELLLMFTYIICMYDFCYTKNFFLTDYFTLIRDYLLNT